MGLSGGLAEPRGLGLGPGPCVCPPFQEGRTSHSARHCECPRGHDCMLFSHDACPAQGGLWGPHLRQRVQNRLLPSPDQAVTGGGPQRPRHTLNHTLPMYPLASAPPPLKPGWAPEWPLRGSGGSGGWGARARLFPGSCGGDGSCGRVSRPISAWGSAAPESRPGERRPTRPALGVPSWIHFGSASAPRALPDQRWIGNAHRGHLPGGEASRLGSRRRAQSFPWLCRSLSVHLLQDRV